jgi:hypothetical protein
MTAKLPPTADDFGAFPPDAALSPEEEEAEWASWWTQLPDFIKPDYPLDLPPNRMPAAGYLFTVVGAPRFCPEASCRRAGTCQGGDGPPCFRADRKNLSQVLFLSWMMIYGDMAEEECARAMRRTGNRYALARRAGSRGKRRGDAAKSPRLG